MKLLWFMFFLQLSYIPEKTEGININVNGSIQVKPQWMYVPDKNIGRSGDSSNEHVQKLRKKVVKIPEPIHIEYKLRKQKHESDYKEATIGKNVSSPESWFIEVAKKIAKQIDLNEAHISRVRKERKTDEVTEEAYKKPKDPEPEPEDQNTEASKKKITQPHRHSKKRRTTNGTITLSTTTTSTTEGLKNVDDYFNRVARVGEDDGPGKLDQIFRNNSGLYDSPHVVKDDKNIKDFTAHIYKEALRTLSDIKGMFNTTTMKKKSDVMTQEYKDKFADFVNETLQQRVKTRIGTQKVILNMIDVSNRILRKTVDSLKSEVQIQRGKGHLREYRNISTDKIDKRVDNQADLEYLHACQNLGICRSTNGFSHFLASIITEALKNDDTKLRQANDAITEALQYADVSDVVDEDMKKDYKKKIEYMERLDSVELRSTYQELRNMLVSGNKPMTVHTDDKKIVRKSLALRDLIDILEQRIPPTDINKAEWETMSLMMQEWTLGQTANIQEVVKKLTKQILSKSVTRTDGGVLYSIQEKLMILLKNDE